MNKISNIDNKRIGRILKRERELKHLTLDELATRIECARPTLNLYETGARPIPANRVTVLAKALDLDPSLIDPLAA